MVILRTSHFAAAVECQLAGSPSTDMRNTDAAAVRFMLRNVLDTVFSPHLNFLLFGRCFIALEIQVFENNYVSRIKDVEKIGGDIEKQAVSQLDMLLRSMVDNNQKPDTTKTGNSGQDCRDIPVVHRQQTLQKRLPQCRLELLPELLAANEAPREVNIYYGRVLCEVVSDKTPYKGADVKVLVVKDIVTKKVIMGLTMVLYNKS